MAARRAGQRQVRAEDSVYSSGKVAADGMAVQLQIH
jgi:hypothetical protein